jgi:DNA replication protein DnaC
MEKLQAMRLRAMAEAWTAQAKNPELGSLDFDDRFGMLVDAEFQTRDNRKLGKLLADAQLRFPQACTEDVDAIATRGLEKSLLRQLATCTWVNENHNVTITGKTGVGKSYLACALGQAACRHRERVLYRRVPRLLDELALARADGTYAKLLAKLAKTRVLILDDLGLGHPTESQRHDLLEVMEDRYGRSATIVTSQLTRDKWHAWIGDPSVADAILDRLIHNAYKIDLKGPSRRKERNVPETTT